MTVLHIDDYFGVTEMVKLLCREHAYVDSVHSLAEAKEHLRIITYDLLLIDLNLGDSRGMDTIVALKDYGIPMVVLTADPTESFATKAAELGVADYISKHVLPKIDLPVRLSFVSNKFRKAKKSMFSWTGLDQLKPYLACSILA